MPKRLVIVAGTRPEIIKTYSILRSLDKLGVTYSFVWTSQHYDYEMSRVFFEELNLPEPDYYLNVPRSTALTERFTSIIVGLASSIGVDKDTIVYALGDTASTLAAAVAAAYSGAVFVHDEAGVRSFDPGMVEEVNRRLADQVAWLHLAPSPFAMINLIVEGVPCNTVIPTGSTLVDIFEEIYPLATRRSEDVLSRLDVYDNFMLVTVHRRENLSYSRLSRIVDIMLGIARRYDIMLVFPLHPHTRNKLRDYNLMKKLTTEKRIKLVKPLSYVEFLALLSRSKAVLTDSGGVQQEAFLAGKPTLTLRPNTEWVETVLFGYNNVVDLDWEKIVYVLDTVFFKQLSGKPIADIYGDGRSGERVARILSSIMEGVLYQHLAGARRQLSKGLLVPTPPKGARGRYSANTVCYHEDRIVPRCGVWDAVSTIPDDAYCLTLAQFRLSCRGDVGFLKRLASSLQIDWRRVDNIIDSWSKV